MAENTEAAPKKKGFFRRLFRLAFIGAAIAGVVAFFKRRRGSDFDDEWQELPPPAGG